MHGSMDAAGVESIAGRFELGFGEDSANFEETPENTTAPAPGDLLEKPHIPACRGLLQKGIWGGHSPQHTRRPRVPILPTQTKSSGAMVGSLEDSGDEEGLANDPLALGRSRGLLAHPCDQRGGGGTQRNHPEREAQVAGLSHRRVLRRHDLFSGLQFEVRPSGSHPSDPHKITLRLVLGLVSSHPQLTAQYSTAFSPIC